MDLNSLVPTFDGYLKVGSKLAGAPGYFVAGPAATKERAERARIYIKLVKTSSTSINDIIDNGLGPHELSKHDGNGGKNASKEYAE